MELEQIVLNGLVAAKDISEGRVKGGLFHQDKFMSDMPEAEAQYLCNMMINWYERTDSREGLFSKIKRVYQSEAQRVKKCDIDINKLYMKNIEFYRKSRNISLGLAAINSVFVGVYYKEGIGDMMSQEGLFTGLGAIFTAVYLGAAIMSNYTMKKNEEQQMLNRSFSTDVSIIKYKVNNMTYEGFSEIMDKNELEIKNEISIKHI